jgi:carbonic anhydrase
MTPDEVLQRLREGNRRFVDDQMQRPHQDAARRKSVVDGQEPFAVVLCCADSRVVPELLFDAGLGDLFVIRVAGTIANLTSIASIEFAVEVLGVQVAVVMAHEGCGAVKAAVEGGGQGPNIDHLLSHIAAAVAHGGSQDEIARRNAQNTAGRLLRRSDILDRAASEKRLTIVPAFYHLTTGVVDFLEP